MNNAHPIYTEKRWFRHASPLAVRAFDVTGTQSESANCVSPDKGKLREYKLISGFYNQHRSTDFLDDFLSNIL